MREQTLEDIWRLLGQNCEKRCLKVLYFQPWFYLFWPFFSILTLFSIGSSTLFSSIANINMETFSMSFGPKILSDSGFTSHQTLSFHFSILKWAFFSMYFQIWGFVTPQSLIFLQPKLTDKLLTLFQVIDRKIGDFTHHLASFLPS